MNNSTPASPKPIYLDFAAATPLDPKVLAAMQPYFSDEFYNPSASYLAAKKVRDSIDKARQTIASILGAKPAEIIFTAGGSEANNLAIFGVAANYPKSHLVYSALEHESVLEPMRELKKRGFKTTEIKPKTDGVIDPNALMRAITDETVLVSVMYANNEIGTIQPLRQISLELEKIRAKRQADGNKTPLYFHTDAAQAGNYLDLSVHRLGVDLMSINGGKIYGPKQSGALFVSRQVNLKPLILGGGQERNLRSGTENVAAIVGLAKALGLAQAMRKKENKRMETLRQDFIQGLNNYLPQAVINGSLSERLANNLHMTIPGTDNERLIFALDEKGILCAAGSACSASKDEPSHVLKSIGLSDKDIRSSLRFSLGRSTTKADIKSVVKALAQLV